MQGGTKSFSPGPKNRFCAAVWRHQPFFRLSTKAQCFLASATPSHLNSPLDHTFANGPTVLSRRRSSTDFSVEVSTVSNIDDRHLLKSIPSNLRAKSAATLTCCISFIPSLPQPLDLVGTSVFRLKNTHNTHPTSCCDNA